MSQSAGSSTLGPAFFNAAPSVTTGGSVAGDQQSWSAWFGQPNTEKPVHPYSLTNRSTWVLPMAYYGKSEFFGNTFKLLALAGNSFLTTVILPLKATNFLQANWGRYEFPAYLPDMVPDLGVTRHVKMNFIEQSASLVRYGIGMQMQHGFMTTEIGRACYVMHLRQINQAMMEGLQFECLYALVNSGNWAVKESTKTDSWNTASAQNALFGAIEREKRAWGITQLNAEGHVQMDSFIEETNQPYNNEPLTTYIMDARIHSFLTQKANDQITYSIYGEGVREKLKYGLRFDYTDIRGNQVFCTRRLLVEEQSINPLERQAEIGEFVVSYDSETSIATYTYYESGDRTLSIYSDDHDAWKQITLQEMHDNSFRFDENTGRLRHFSNRYDSTSYLDNRDKDHLFHKINGDIVPLSFFGQMKHEHFTTHDYEALNATVNAQIARSHRKTASKINESLAKISNIIGIMHRAQLNDAYNLWLRTLSAANGKRHTNNADNALSYAPLVEVQGNAYNSLPIPLFVGANAGAYGDEVKFDTIKAGLQLPPTHGTYGGLKTISELISSKEWNANNVPFNVELASGLPEALKHFEQYVSQLEIIFPESALLVSRNASEYFHEPTPKDVIFENYFGINHPSRAIFLRTSDGQVQNRVANASARPQREWESLFPQIASARQILEDRYTGSLRLATDAQSAGIGERYGKTARGAVPDDDEDILWRWGPVEADSTAAAVRRALFGATAVTGRPVDTDGPAIPAGANTVEVPAAPYTATGVFLLNWMLNPYDQDDANADTAAKQAIVLSFLAALKDDGANLAAIDATLVAAAAAVAAANPNGASAKNVADALVAAISRNTNDIVSKLTRGFRVERLQKLYGSILKAREQATGYWGLGAAAGPIADPNPDRRETQDLYYRAPITIGRAAIRDYVSSRNSISYGIPASHLNPKNPMTHHEVTLAAQLVAAGADPNRSTDYSQVGAIFEPQSRNSAKLDIRNLPFIRHIDAIAGRDDERATQRAQLKAIEQSYQNLGASAYELTQLDNYGERLAKKRSWQWTQEAEGASREAEKTRDDLFDAAYSTLIKPAELFGDDEITPAFQENFRLAASRLTGTSLLVSLVFMFSAVVKNALDCIIRNNILFPWNFILARPHATYTTLTTIKCRPGEGLGNSYIAKIETEASDDTSVHLHTLNVNYWAGVIITNYEQLFTVNNSFICGYKGGLGVEFYNPLEYSGDIQTNRRNMPSIMSFSIPRHEKIDDEHISISGKASWYTRDGEAIDLAGIDNRFGYSSSAFYAGHYGFYDVAYNTQTAIPGGASRYTARARAPNAICFASTAIYNSFRDHKPAYRTVQRGHWRNETVGAGAHAARIGQASFNNQPTAFASTLQTIGVC